MFEFERLVAWQKAMAAAERGYQLIRRLPQHQGFARLQIARSLMSVVLNIAEGAGEFSRADKARFYRIARRSATEAASGIMLYRRLGYLDEREVQATLGLLRETVSILTTMTKKLGNSEVNE